MARSSSPFTRHPPLPGREKTMVYVDHPLGERSDVEKWTQNIDNAGKWAKWLFKQTPFAILIPWWPLVVLIDDPMDQPRLLTDQVLMILRCADILVQCGGNVSTHMREHEEHARRKKIPVANLTQFAVHSPYGALPPDDSFKQQRSEYRRAIAELSRAFDAM